MLFLLGLAVSMYSIRLDPAWEIWAQDREEIPLLRKAAERDASLFHASQAFGWTCVACGFGFLVSATGLAAGRKYAVRLGMIVSVGSALTLLTGGALYLILFRPALVAAVVRAEEREGVAALDAWVPGVLLPLAAYPVSSSILVARRILRWKRTP
ncbi:MAG: hypothetical protein HY720_26020 [Planctomycetes bacterium]|nr:hypothetical protein [Planctomycetota bacterium]